MDMRHLDKKIIITLTILFILINLPPDITYIASFKNIVLGFGYTLGGCILSALGGVVISAIAIVIAARIRKKNIHSLDTVKLILICSILVGLLLKIKK